MSQIPVNVALAVIAAAALLAAAIRRSLLRWTSVTSHSMAPTLRPGQRRLTLRARTVRRLQPGDIVVLRSVELGTDVIKRVVGLPGDHVHIGADGAVEVNGTQLPERYVTFPGGPDGRFHVPAGRILVLGDNRANSDDSRRWRNAYVPQTALRGRLLRHSTSRADVAGAYAPLTLSEDHATRVHRTPTERRQGCSAAVPHRA